MKTRIWAFALAAAAAAAQHHHGGKGKEVEFTGLVVDTGCYISHNSKGDKHTACATSCARAGVPLAILEDATNVVYIPIAVDHKNQNEKLMPFIERKVKVTGTVMEKGGVKGVAIKVVEAVK